MTGAVARVVFDMNILDSGHFWKPRPYRCSLAAEARLAVLVLSDSIVSELRGEAYRSRSTCIRCGTINSWRSTFFRHDYDARESLPDGYVAAQAIRLQSEERRDSARVLRRRHIRSASEACRA